MNVQDLLPHYRRSLALLRAATLMWNGSPFAPFLVPYLLILGFNMPEITVLITIRQLSPLALNLPAARLTERYGSKPSLIIGGMCYAVSTGYYYFAGHSWPLIAAAGLLSAMGGCLFSGANLVLARRLYWALWRREEWPAKYAQYVANVTAYGGLSEALGALCASGLVLAFGLHAAIVGQLLVILIITGIACWLQDPPPRTRAKRINPRVVQNIHGAIDLRLLDLAQTRPDAFAYLIQHSDIPQARRFNMPRLWLLKQGVLTGAPPQFIDNSGVVVGPTREHTQLSSDIQNALRQLNTGPAAPDSQYPRKQVAALVIASGAMAGFAAIAYRLAPLYYRSADVFGHRLPTGGFGLLWGALLVSMIAFKPSPDPLKQLTVWCQLSALKSLAVLGGFCYIALGCHIWVFGLAGLVGLFFVRANDTPIINSLTIQIGSSEKQATTLAAIRVVQEVVASGVMLLGALVHSLSLSLMLAGIIPAAIALGGLKVITAKHPRTNELA